MKYLLDTHVLLHFLMKPKALPSSITKILSDEKNECLVSAVNFWEISLKYILGKLDLKGVSPVDIKDVCIQMNLGLIGLSCDEAVNYHQLSVSYHKDPFDKMLIWQAIQNHFTLLSVDKTIKQYKTIGLKVIG